MNINTMISYYQDYLHQQISESIIQVPDTGMSNTGTFLENA